MVRQYRDMEIQLGDLVPAIRDAVTRFRVYGQQQVGRPLKKEESSGNRSYVDKKVKPSTDKGEYEEAMDEIDDLLEDEEQAEQYVQMSGQ